MKNYMLLILVLSALMACAFDKQKHQRHQLNQPYLKKVYYDGTTDDLLTAGLGLSGLRGPAPEISATPTAKALRQASYYHQFRALNDLTAAGGYGRLYGMKENQKPIAGFEYWSQRKLQAGPLHTVVVQIPDHLNREHPCLVVAPSSGSRNVLGAVGTSGAWALLQGCAVVYTDKGSGTEIALIGDQAYQIDGVVKLRTGDQTGLLSARKLQPASDLHVIQTHAYSQAHPEQFWGEFVLDAAQYALQLLKAERELARKQVHVVAASLSNGGGAVLRAAEKDLVGIIDAVVAGEPQVNLQHTYILQQHKKNETIVSKPLLKIANMMSLMEPCAALDSSLMDAPFKANTLMIQALLINRCQALVAAGLIAGKDVSEQAAAALQKILAMHIEPAALQLSQINTLVGMWSAINHTYSNSYLQKTAQDNLCQSAMSAFTSTGEPRPLTVTEVNNMFALSNGIAPSNGVELAHTNAENEVQSRMILAADFGLSSQLCFADLRHTSAMQTALQKIMAQPHKNKLPTIILHGQDDGTVAVNHTSRAYYHRNQSADHQNTSLKYYEIQNAQHFDAFLAYPGFKEKYVPMHPYFEQAMEMMLNHLRHGSSLPPSQVIPTQPRGQNNDLEALHVPVIRQQAEKTITLSNNQLVIQ
ncbi:3-hydroxybutyrate oligomer hydrolase family protein [Marinicella sp. S1101]|uniref:3-hydroxybutyrate oligomer hydrolase family protein n=1 Tax=Marinicella marina TaxID=2996016 RepID=UPI002260F1BA|nr:3-hydroxybutyrate oligomer hydrolase family protein [Marinicella marina]MCX7552475.1 3-hydroxybutyrate oligomer hydrolase family protein [Marinicella marina]MDJ1139351.1 3-hydroxybutyrate oligomer hydrolase family protein [Marinicella marina]